MRIQGFSIVALSLLLLPSCTKKPGEGALSPQDSLKAMKLSEDFRIELVAAELRSAAAIASDAQLKKYLELRATALETDDYRPSDFAWMEMKRNTVDVVIGPIETYEDHRMAMSLAPLALRTGSITVQDPGVVAKSYPGFWEHLRTAGFGVA